MLALDIEQPAVRLVGAPAIERDGLVQNEIIHTSAPKLSSIEVGVSAGRVPNRTRGDASSTDLALESRHLAAGRIGSLPSSAVAFGSAGAFEGRQTATGTPAQVPGVFVSSSRLQAPLNIPPSQSPPPAALSEAQKNEIRSKYENQPLRFEANKGQVDERVDFYARSGNSTVFLMPNEAVFSVRPPTAMAESGAARESGLPPRAMQKIEAPQQGMAVRMEIIGGNSAATPVQQEQKAGTVNYMLGNNPQQWQTNVATYGRVEYADVYPGIDIVYYGKDQNLEYDFVVAPGADPQQIKLGFTGADSARLDDSGALVLQGGGVEMRQQTPYLYQENNGVRQQVAGEFVLTPAGSSPGLETPTYEVSFEIGAYDPTRPLVIDPLVLNYSSYVGSAPRGDVGLGFAVDNAGNYYMTGLTESTNFPATPGAYDSTYNGGMWDIMVFKVNASGTGIAYATYIGASGDDQGLAIAVDAGGNIYVTGQTDSPDFPTTAGAHQTVHKGDFDGYMLKLSADGSSLAYSTLLGGAGKDVSWALRVDGSGNAYVTGQTDSADFPTTPGAFDTTISGEIDAFVTKVATNGTFLVYSTFLGGADDDYGYGLDLDGGGNVYVAGSTFSVNFPITAGAYDTTLGANADDAFVAKLSSDGSSLALSTFLGGSFSDPAAAITVDGSGNIHVTGNTNSTDYPTTPGAFDQTYSNAEADTYVAKLNAAGTVLLYSTYLGGNSFDFGRGIAVDSNGFTWVVGWTKSTDFPTTGDAFDLTANGSRDIFICKVNSTGGLDYSTYMGGNASDGFRGHGIVVRPGGLIYLGGWSDSSNFPTTPGAYKRRNRAGIEAYVAKFTEV
jgi:hypothetical protein